MTQFFYDTEFLEDGKRIHPISIGVVLPDGTEFYRVYADTLFSLDALRKIREHRWLMTNVVPHLPDMAQKIIRGELDHPASGLEYFASHPVIAPKWRIAMELEELFNSQGRDRDEHELWAYYGSYDHVVLAQTFGTMMQLPGSVPMFTRDLMQLEADVNGRRKRFYLEPVQRPSQLGNQHAALADARWNMAFYQALVSAAAQVDDSPWLIDPLADTVIVPSRFFVAGFERLMSMGPNEGIDPADETPAEATWRALF